MVKLRKNSDLSSLGDNSIVRNGWFDDEESKCGDDLESVSSSRKNNKQLSMSGLGNDEENMDDLIEEL